MSSFRRLARGVVVHAIFSAAILCAAGCGFDRLMPTLPDAIPGFTLADLKSIQDDERLTTAEKQEQIRTAIGAPSDADGDRLVDFLLNLTVP